MAALSFIHVYQPGSDAARRRTLLTLHAAGGSERDLIALTRLLQPGAGVLSPRGPILENGRWRFFRRLTPQVDDIEDLQRRAAQLATFLAESAACYGFDPMNVVAIGVADGAVLATTMLLAWPHALAGAVLFRAGLPAMPERMPALPKTPVFVSNGLHDRFARRGDTVQLEALLRAAGADVTIAWQASAHQLIQADLERAAAWLTACGPRRSSTQTS